MFPCSRTDAANKPRKPLNNKCKIPICGGKNDGRFEGAGCGTQEVNIMSFSVWSKKSITARETIICYSNTLRL